MIAFINRLLLRWHQYRLRVWQNRLDLVNVEIPILEKAEREYGSSTYTDKFHDAICRRQTAMSAVKYYSDKLGKRAFGVANAALELATGKTVYTCPRCLATWTRKAKVAA